MKRTFDISDVLSVTTGHLLSSRHMDGLYDILGFMSSDPYITTIGLMVVIDDARDCVLSQHPQLAEIEKPDFSEYVETEASKEAAEKFVQEMADVYGESFELEPIANYSRMSDIEKIIEVRGNADNVIPIIVDTQEN